MNGSMTAVKRGIFVGVVLLGIITTLAPAVQAAVLWVVPDDPNRYDMSSETVIDDADMGTTFSDNVLVALSKNPVIFKLFIIYNQHFYLFCT